jgi:Domain of unknown function (DUF4258)
MADEPLKFTAHARTALAERRIAEEWVRRVLDGAEWTEPDPSWPGNMLAFGRIPEFGNRLLRVVYREVAGERRVITAYFDRTRARQGRAP